LYLPIRTADLASAWYLPDWQPIKAAADKYKKVQDTARA